MLGYDQIAIDNKQKSSNSRQASHNYHGNLGCPGFWGRTRNVGMGTGISNGNGLCRIQGPFCLHQYTSGRNWETAPLLAGRRKLAGAGPRRVRTAAFGGQEEHCQLGGGVCGVVGL